MGPCPPGTLCAENWDRTFGLDGSSVPVSVCIAVCLCLSVALCGLVPGLPLSPLSLSPLAGSAPPLLALHEMFAGETPSAPTLRDLPTLLCSPGLALVTSCSQRHCPRPPTKASSPPQPSLGAFVPGIRGSQTGRQAQRGQASSPGSHSSGPSAQGYLMPTFPARSQAGGGSQDGDPSLGRPLLCRGPPFNAGVPASRV